MAKVTGPLHSSEARGRMGALVYNTWRGINYVKIHTDPATQFSDAQVTLRALTADVTVSWQALSAATRAAWYAYANKHPSTSCLADRTRLTAYNWYVRINVRRLLLAGAISSLVPAFELKHNISNLNYDTDPLVIYVQWDFPAAYSPATLYYEVYRTGPHSAAVHANIKNARRRGYATYISQFFEDSVPAAGIYTYFVRPIHSTGVVAPWSRITVTAVA